MCSRCPTAFQSANDIRPPAAARMLRPTSDSASSERHRSANQNARAAETVVQGAVGSKIDRHSGKLELVEVTPSGGKTPRNFDLDPTGAWLVAGNQDSNNLALFAIDRKTGKLHDTGERCEVPAPSCGRFLPLGE